MTDIRDLRCEPHGTVGGDQFCIFCLRTRGDRALVRVAELEALLLELRNFEELRPLASAYVLESIDAALRKAVPQSSEP